MFQKYNHKYKKVQQKKPHNTIAGNQKIIVEGKMLRNLISLYKEHRKTNSKSLKMRNEEPNEMPMPYESQKTQVGTAVGYH